MTRMTVSNASGSWIRCLMWMVFAWGPLSASEGQEGIGAFLERPAADAQSPTVAIQRDERVEWSGFPPIEPLDVAVTEVEFRFSVKNLATTPLRIEEVETGCGCMAAVFDRTAIQPGGSCDVRTTLQVGFAIGLQKKRIQATLVDESGTWRKTYELYATVTIPSLFENNPGAESWKKSDFTPGAPAPSPKRYELRLAKPRGQRVVPPAGSSDGPFTFTIVPTARGCSVEIIPHPSDQALAGTKLISGSIELDVLFPDGKRRPFKVWAFLMP